MIDRHLGNNFADYFNAYIAPYVSEVLPSVAVLKYIAYFFNVSLAYSYLMAVITEPGVIPRKDAASKTNSTDI